MDIFFVFKDKKLQKGWKLNFVNTYIWASATDLCWLKKF